ncbi:hypothetical protein ONE63_007325 [Megalurothrips usitatus]|uniref:MULE transposase domain-containing protein n=1 Tax=Megalurothrips usitatus TaxID=439358 RepID=A0AAV7XSG6_9NEOP|nr:hypothetical protein ONE63_007325 [Megalurothrips usitatus]
MLKFYNCNDYRNNNRGHNSVVHLRCTQHYKRLCQGTAKIEITADGTEWTNLRPHTCAPNATHRQVLHLRQEILRQAVDNFNRPYEPPAALVDRVRAGWPDPNAAAQVPPCRMRSAIYRAQNRLYPRVPVSIYHLGFLLNDNQWQHLTSTICGTDNIFGGVVHGPDGSTSVVFVSRRIRVYMRRARLVFCDGTFGSRPNIPQSSQVLQICSVVNNTVMPLVQVLMNSKSQEAYEAVLRHLRNTIPGFNPQTVMTDFEAGLQNAWREVYHCHVHGCYWHYCRAVLRKVKELRLRPHMQQNRNLRSIIRSMLALPLLPTNLIIRGYRTLMVEAQRTGLLGLLNELFQYWTDTWAAPHVFQSLSVYGLRHRTNNVCESANRLLRSKTGAHRPGLWHFLSALRRNEHCTFLKLRAALMGIPASRCRKVSAVNNDTNIRNYNLQLFRGHISINRFLHLASLRVLRVFDAIVV